MNQHFLLKHKLINIIQLYSLFILLSSLVIYLAFIIGGEMLAILAFVSVFVLYLANPYIASSFILRMYKAQFIPYSSAPALYDMADEIASRAGLTFTPKLYYIPSSVINSFAVGRANQSVIAISDGILTGLSYEEIGGILGHEISHIKSDDISVMTFADVAGRIVKVLSLMGQAFILLSLPLTMMTNSTINWLPFIIVISAPIVSDLVQLGLSRLREYEADIGSALLLGDARPLASALKKINYYEHNYFRSMIFPMQKIPEPSLLRTHPKTEERIRRLLEIQKTIEKDPTKHHENIGIGTDPYHYIDTRHRHPRRHSNGFWY